MKIHHHHLIPIILAAIMSLFFCGCDKINDDVHSHTNTQMESSANESPADEQELRRDKKDLSEEKPLEVQLLQEEIIVNEANPDSDESAGAKPDDQNIEHLNPKVPKVSMTPVAVTDNMDKRIIQKIVRQHSGEVRACYEKELYKNKELAGQLVLVWIISSQGSVTSASIKESTIKNKRVEDCVVNSIKHWRFPAPKGGGVTQVEFTFEFEVSSDKD